MSDGCGDDQKTTSYTCFCYLSSAKYNNMLSSKVSQACPNDTAQATTAMNVFHEYCTLAKLETAGTTSVPASTTKVEASSTASPASGPSTVYVTSTPTSQPETTERKTPVVAIAVGVTVPVVVIALGIGAFFVYRRRKKVQEPVELAAVRSDSAGRSIPYSGSEILSSPVYELKSGNAEPVELDTRRPSIELDAPAVSSASNEKRRQVDS